MPEPSSTPEPEPTPAPEPTRAPAPEPEPNQGSKPEPNPAPETNPTAEAESTAATDPTPADVPGAAPEGAAAAEPSEAPVPAAPASDPKYEHPNRKVPDNWVESLRKKLKKGSWWRKQFDTLACPVAEPSEFRVSEAELVRQLTPDGDEAKGAARAAEILEEARNIYKGAGDRADGVTARATTLQEAVGIAATLLIAGAGLIIGQSALRGAGWVVAFALLLFGATLSLVMSGLRALGAASTIHQWYEPTASDIIARSQKSELEARVELAASLLWCYGYNSKVASWKVSYLGAAAWWYRIALAWIVSIAMLVGVYAIVQTGERSGKARAATTTATTSKAPATTTKAVTTTSTPRATSKPATAPSTATTTATATITTSAP